MKIGLYLRTRQPPPPVPTPTPTPYSRDELQIPALVMRRRDPRERRLMVVVDLRLHLLNVPRTGGVAGGVQPRDVVLHEDAVAVGGVETETVAAGSGGRVDEADGDRLDGEAVDLDVDGSGLVGEGGGGEDVVVVVEEGGHVGVGQVRVGALADLVAGAGEGVFVVGGEEGRVGLGLGGVEQGGDGVEVGEDGGGRGRPVVEEEDDVDADEVVERVVGGDDDGGFRVRVVRSEVGRGAEHGRVLRAGVRSRAAPDLADGERLERVLGDDAELVAAALECPEEVGVGGAVGVGDGAVGEDQLHIEQSVDCEAVLVGEETEAAAEDVSSNADMA